MSTQELFLNEQPQHISFRVLASSKPWGEEGVTLEWSHMEVRGSLLQVTNLLGQAPHRMGTKLDKKQTLSHLYNTGAR